MNDVTAINWERVLTVHDFYDCARNGVAEYHGVPHVYQCEWDDSEDDWGHVFRLSPINDEQLSVVMEDWSIWRRYEAKYVAGLLQPDDQYPALAVDWERHKQLCDLIEAILRVDEAKSIRAVPEFRGSIEPAYEIEVRWLSDGNGS